MNAKRLAGFSRGSSILEGVIFATVVGSIMAASPGAFFPPSTSQTAATQSTNTAVIENPGTGQAMCSAAGVHTPRATEVRFACDQIVPLDQQTELIQQSCLQGFEYTITISEDNVSVVPRDQNPAMLENCSVNPRFCNNGTRAKVTNYGGPGKVVTCVNVSIDGLKRGCSRPTVCQTGASLESGFDLGRKDAIADLVGKLEPDELPEAQRQLGSFQGNDQLAEAFQSAAQDSVEEQIQNNTGKIENIQEQIDQCAQSGCRSEDLDNFAQTQSRLQDENQLLQSQLDELASSQTALSPNTTSQQTREPTGSTPSGEQTGLNRDATFGSGETPENAPASDQTTESQQTNRISQIRERANAAMEARRENLRTGDLSKAANYRGSSATDLCKYVYGPGGDCARASSPDRQRLAELLGVEDYSGTAAQNTSLVQRAQNQEEYTIATRETQTETPEIARTPVQEASNEEASGSETNLVNNPPIPQPNPRRVAAENTLASPVVVEEFDTTRTLDPRVAQLREALISQGATEQEADRLIDAAGNDPSQQAGNLMVGIVAKSDACLESSGMYDCFRDAGLNPSGLSSENRRIRSEIATTLGIECQVGSAACNNEMLGDIRNLGVYREEVQQTGEYVSASGERLGIPVPEEALTTIRNPETFERRSFEEIIDDIETCGSANSATCHVYVDARSGARVPAQQVSSYYERYDYSDQEKADTETTIDQRLTAYNPNVARTAASDSLTTVPPSAEVEVASLQPSLAQQYGTQMNAVEDRLSVLFPNEAQRSPLVTQFRENAANVFENSDSDTAGSYIEGVYNDLEVPVREQLAAREAFAQSEASTARISYENTLYGQQLAARERFAQQQASLAVMEPPAIPEPPSFVFPSNTDIHTAQSSREQLLTPPPPASASPVDQVRPATIITTPPPPPPVPPPAYLLTREEREARGIVLFPSTETTSPTPPQQTDSASRGDRLDVTSPQTQAPQSVSQSEQRTPAQPPTQSVTPLEEQSTWELWGTAFSWSSTQHERQQVAPIIIDRVNTWTSDTWSSAAEGVSNWWSNYNFWGN